MLKYFQLFIIYKQLKFVLSENKELMNFSSLDFMEDCDLENRSSGSIIFNHETCVNSEEQYSCDINKVIKRETYVNH